MNYIVFDLEWNQCIDEADKKDLNFEIIEIGAVKLNSKFEIVDTFEEIIKPCVYTELNSIIKGITGISQEEIDKGDSFVTVCERFIKWCEKDYIFCTWGSVDLTELQKNMKYHDMEIAFNFPLRFLDIQKLYGIFLGDAKIRSSLKNVCDDLEIDEEEDFHRAINDAKYTAKVMQMIDMKSVMSYYSIDCFRVPFDRKRQIHAVFDTYEKFISMGFKDREDVIRNEDIKAVRCYKCMRNCKHLIKWFSNANKVYYGLFSCKEHGYIKGKIRVKQAGNGKYYGVRILKITDQNGADKVKEQKKRVISKRS